MTCIVGVERNGVVWMGGDSAGTSSNMNQRIRGDKKVFIKGEFIFGFCGSFRMGQLLQYNLKLPVQASTQKDFEFLVNDFVKAVKVCVSEGKEETPGFEGAFLFGYRGKLYGVQGDYQVSKPELEFDATGSGADIAVGAMHASMKGWSSPKKRLTQALEASALNNAAVMPPFTIMSLKNGAGKSKRKK
jgi:ATP-dependent protease HslVU (ClpYQ) peptidase subunit